MVGKIRDRWWGDTWQRDQKKVEEKREYLGIGGGDWRTVYDLFPSYDCATWILCLPRGPYVRQVVLLSSLPRRVKSFLFLAWLIKCKLIILFSHTHL